MLSSSISINIVIVTLKQKIDSNYYRSIYRILLLLVYLPSITHPWIILLSSSLRFSAIVCKFAQFGNFVLDRRGNDLYTIGFGRG